MVWVNWLDDTLDKTKKPIFYLILLAHVLYFGAYFGMIAVLPDTLAWLDFVTQSFICVFLLVRFNPMRKEPTELGTYDKRLIFGSGVLLFSNLIAIKIARYLNIRF